jgi:predicted N-acetyltransferase YhbS
VTRGGIVLDVIAPEDYVRMVLPRTESLWAGARTFDEYVAEFRAIAASSWGKRRFRTLGLRIDGELVASMKRYERVLRCGSRTYKGAGIGAVFTPEELRGRGYATAMIAAFLDAERAAGTDFAYLFSDLHPAFYEKIGFVPLPSRTISLRADMLSPERIDVVALGASDATSMRRVFAALDRRRPFAFERTPLDWEWQRLRWSSREHTGQQVALGVRRGRTLAAYVTGRRLPSLDAFVLDEFAYARDDDAARIQPLLRAAAGDLRTVRGWLPPLVARDALPRGAVRARPTPTTMLVPLSTPFRSAFGARANDKRDPSDPLWSTDHI